MIQFNNIKQRINNATSLASIVLSPLSEEHEWGDVEVVTLKQHTIDKVTDYVLSNVVTLTNVQAQINNELSNVEAQICREFVDVQPDKIVIGMWCNTVDDRVIDKAVAKLMKMESISQGMHYDGPEHIIDFSSRTQPIVV